MTSRRGNKLVKNNKTGTCADVTSLGKIEGSWDEVMRLIGQAHVMLHQKGVLRIQTDIRVGSRLAP